MNQIILRKDFLELYNVEEFIEKPLDILAEFLISDGMAGTSIKNFDPANSPYLQWLKDSDLTNDWMGGNALEMIKRNEVIILRLQYEVEDMPFQEFSISGTSMIEIFNQWYEILLMKPRPARVDLIQEGDAVSLVLQPDESHLYAFNMGKIK